MVGLTIMTVVITCTCIIDLICHTVKDLWSHSVDIGEKVPMTPANDELVRLFNMLEIVEFTSIDIPFEYLNIL